MRTGTFSFMIILSLITLASAQQLRVDSVNVDTVLNSDSSWYDGQGILQQRYSRDLFLSFKPMGGGTAQCFVAMSIDSAKTWAPSPNPLSVLDNGIAAPVQCGTKGRVKLRVLGQDRPGISFKVTARQWQPIIAGNPNLVIMGLISALTPGVSCSVNLQCNQLNEPLYDTVALGYSTILKVWWDAFGTAGTWSDSTSSLSYMWLTTVPTGASGQKQVMIAKARDANGLWSAPCTLTVQFGLKRPLTMVSIPAGTFQMGSANTALEALFGEDAEPVHSVTLGAFTMSQTLITQEQYQAVMGINPAYYDSGMAWPVEQVSWYDAALFCNALSKLAGKDTVYNYTGTMGTTVVINYSKNGYRLPTEAEYEYASRAGTTTDYYWGRNYPLTTHADTLAIDSNAVWYYNSPNSTQPVATKKPNAYGLYDMSGNLWEFCNDWYGNYSSGSQTNPTGAASGYFHVLRGGSWDFSLIPFYLCAACRYNDAPVSNFDPSGCGFRVVCGPR